MLLPANQRLKLTEPAVDDVAARKSYQWKLLRSTRGHSRWNWLHVAAA